MQETAEQFVERLRKEGGPLFQGDDEKNVSEIVGSSEDVIEIIGKLRAAGIVDFKIGMLINKMSFEEFQNSREGLSENEELAVILNERSRHIKKVLEKLKPAICSPAHPYPGGADTDIEIAFGKILSFSDKCYLQIDKLRRAVSKTFKSKFFSGSAVGMGISKMETAVNEFCAGKTVRNISMQEASDLIICMVNYEE